MKSIILTAVLSTMISMNLTAQNQWPIFIGKEGSKTTYQQNGKYLTQKELAEVLKSNTESIKEYNKSAILDKTAGVFIIPGFISSCAGVVYSGLALIAYIDSNNDKASKYRTNAGITLISGVGLIIIGGTFVRSSGSHLTKSINNYNNTLKTGRTGNVIIYFGFTGEGVGVRLRF
ncbi:MAG: hypothetical protein NTZ85_02545 [Bacteroidia bacterium]|nr:hypothetical protein [Bacteroidia bacterium]